jgi:hypothetical protein
MRKYMSFIFTCCTGYPDSVIIAVRDETTTTQPDIPAIFQCESDWTLDNGHQTSCEDSDRRSFRLVGKHYTSSVLECPHVAIAASSYLSLLATAASTSVVNTETMPSHSTAAL